MQPWRIALALMLFLAPLGARGQEPTQPASVEEPCSVPADPSWTPQEKFVWEHVCAGEGADFNAAPGYGGPLDPTKPEGWPQNRVLRPKFLKMILFKDPYRSALTRNGVLIVGARFTEAINLENAELEHPFGLAYSLLEKDVDLEMVRSKFTIAFAGSNVAGTLQMLELELSGDLWIQNGHFTDVKLAAAHVGELDLRGSKVTGTLDMSDLQVDRNMFMSNQAEFAEVDLSTARVGGQLGLSSSKVTGKLNMNALQVVSDLFMSDQAEFAEVELIGANVGGQLGLSSSKVTGKLNMNGLHVGSQLIMRDKAEFAEVDLTRAHVGDTLSLAGSKVSGTLDMNSLEVGGSLQMRNNATFADVVLLGAHVGGQLDLSGSKVTGKLNMNSLQVDRNIFMSNHAEFVDVDLIRAHAGGQLDLSGSKVSGKLNMNGLQVGYLFMRDKAEFADVDLNGAHVGGVLDLSGSKVGGNITCYSLVVEQHVSMGAEFDGRIDCTIATIKGDLYLTGGQFKQDVDLSGAEIDGGLHLASADWADGVTLVLRDAKVLGTIPGLADAWAPKLELDGFTYRSAGAADQFKDWFGRLEHYAPQPYEQLASVIQSQGHSALATEIRYSGRERERSEATDGAWAWLTTLKWLIGYGYYPYYAMGWAIGLVIVGALVLRVSREGPPDIISYSFDMLLPIIRLRESHFQIDLKTWARYYFYFHKIMGYVLASFLIAGLAGLTK